MANNIFFQPFVGKHYADGGMRGARQVSARVCRRLGQAPLGQDAGRAMAGRRADSSGRVQHGDGRLSLEQRQACEGDGGEPSFGRLFVGLLVSCVGKILLALNGGKNNAGFRNDCFRNLRFVNRYAGGLRFCQ